jgi:hypothetical protein
MTRELIQTAPNIPTVANLKDMYPSIIERNQYSKFFFGKERDASHFAKDFNPKTIPARDFLKGTWVVQL